MSNEKTPQEVFAALRQIMPTLTPDAREVLQYALQHLPEHWEEVSDEDRAIFIKMAQTMNDTMKDRIAPPGMYRVLKVGGFDGAQIHDDFDRLEEALERACNKTAQAASYASSASIKIVYVVYDDTGKYLGP